MVLWNWAQTHRKQICTQISGTRPVQTETTRQLQPDLHNCRRTKFCWSTFSDSFLMIWCFWSSSTGRGAVRWVHTTGPAQPDRAVIGTFGLETRRQTFVNVKVGPRPRPSYFHDMSGRFLTCGIFREQGARFRDRTNLVGWETRLLGDLNGAHATHAACSKANRMGKPTNHLVALCWKVWCTNCVGCKWNSLQMPKVHTSIEKILGAGPGSNSSSEIVWKVSFVVTFLHFFWMSATCCLTVNWNDNFLWLPTPPHMRWNTIQNKRSSA